MSFSLPNFNLLGKLWDSPHKANAVAADHVDVPMALYLPSKGLLDLQYGTALDWLPPVYGRFPIAQAAAWRALGMLECPSGSGRYYLTRFKERMHQGFSNEYLIAILDQCTDAGVPAARDVSYSLAGPVGGGGGGGGGGSPGTWPVGGTTCLGAAVIPYTVSATYTVDISAGGNSWFKWNFSGHASVYYSVASGGVALAAYSTCPGTSPMAGPGTTFSVMDSTHWLLVGAGPPSVGATAGINIMAM